MRTRLLSIHRDQSAAIRSRDRLPDQLRQRSWVELAPAGSTSERPWGVLAPAAGKKGG
jgi:hypothetical protein